MLFQNSQTVVVDYLSAVCRFNRNVSAGQQAVLIIRSIDNHVLPWTFSAFIRGACKVEFLSCALCSRYGKQAKHAVAYIWK